jgi:hypothetical protein
MWQRISAIVLLFCTALAQAEDPGASRVKEPELRLELLRRVKTDQEARNALIRWLKEQGLAGMFKPADLAPERKEAYDKLTGAIRRADQDNTDRLGVIVEKYGWPTNTLVGKDGANAAWLLVQHADANPKFQRKCLDLMKKLPKDEVSPTEVAYLTDRVLLAEGKKQVYGTQMTSSGGKWEPRPLEDPANVDKRRAEVGLKPMAEYVKELQSFYGTPAKK